MTSRERVVLIDGSGLFFAAYFALPGNLMTRDGIHTNAVFGFCNTFRKILDAKTPSIGAVVFDAPGGTFREEKYPAYKAQRPRVPSDLIEQIPLIDRVVHAHNFPLLRVSGFEADDVIGTLTRQALEPFPWTIGLTTSRTGRPRSQPSAEPNRNLSGSPPTAIRVVPWSSSSQRSRFPSATAIRDSSRLPTELSRIVRK